jgi:hypothetical protein
VVVVGVTDPLSGKTSLCARKASNANISPSTLHACSRESTVTQNGTWFELHVLGTDIKGSIFSLDCKSGITTRMGSFRFRDGSHQVIPLK